VLKSLKNSLDNLNECNNYTHFIDLWCSGSTSDFDSESLDSNSSRSTK
jgi:hypothetical protein